MKKVILLLVLTAIAASSASLRKNPACRREAKYNAKGENVLLRGIGLGGFHASGTLYAEIIRSSCCTVLSGTK